MTTVFRQVGDPSFRGSSTKRNINKPCKSMRSIILRALLMATGTFVIGTSVKACAAITISQLNGTWQIALEGNTCGATSMVFTGNLVNGSAAGWPLTRNGGCAPGTSNETFTITSV